MADDHKAVAAAQAADDHSAAVAAAQATVICLLELKVSLLETGAPGQLQVCIGELVLEVLALLHALVEGDLDVAERSWRGISLTTARQLSVT